MKENKDSKLKKKCLNPFEKSMGKKLMLPFEMFCYRCAVFTETCHRFLDLTGPLQIGGLPSLPTHFQVSNKDFVGCISDLYIDHKFIDLNR